MIPVKAEEEACADATAAVAANTPHTSSINTCVPPVYQVVLQSPGCPAPQFRGAFSVANSMVSLYGMQQYGPPQAYHDERYMSHPSSYAGSVVQPLYHP